MLTIFLLLGSFQLFASTEFFLEGGLVENTYNEVAIPGDAGTQFDLGPSFSGLDGYYRLEFSHVFNKKHGVRLLYAPLKKTGEATYNEDILFQGASFTKGKSISTLFEFNSYRATYFYEFANTKSFKARLGGTLKVRDAQIRLEQEGVVKKRSDLGFVPLIYFYTDYHWQNGTRVAFTFDGLVAPQGRAIDAAVMIGKNLNQNLSFNLGYRVLEGGADNDKVYNFSLFNYYFVAFLISF